VEIIVMQKQTVDYQHAAQFQQEQAVDVIDNL
jgi:hypothetical protein